MGEARKPRNDTLEMARWIRHDALMSTVGIYEAKKHFSKLLRRAMSGEEIVITRSGDPIVRLEAIGVLEQRRFGTDVGVVEVPEDFDAIAVPEVGEASQ